MMSLLLLAGALCACIGVVAGQASSNNVSNNETQTTGGAPSLIGVLLEDSGAANQTQSSSDSPQGMSSTIANFVSTAWFTTTVPPTSTGVQSTSVDFSNTTLLTISPAASTGMQSPMVDLTNTTWSTTGPSQITGMQSPMVGLTNTTWSTTDPSQITGMQNRTGDIASTAQLSTVPTLSTDGPYNTSVTIVLLDGWPQLDIAIPSLRALLNVTPHVTLDSVVQAVTKRGTVIARFQPTINDIPVYDRRVTAEFNQNGIATGWVDGGGTDVAVDHSCSTNLAISERRALYILAQEFKVCKFRRYLVVQEFKFTYYIDNQSNVARLAYRLSALFTNESSRQVQQFLALIYACSGQVIEKWSGFTALTTATIKAIGGNSGPVVGKKQYTDLEVGLQPDGTCVYWTPDVLVQDMRSATNIPFNATSFTCSQASDTAYDFTNGGYSPLNDVAANCQTTVAMLRKYIGPDGLKGMFPVQARVHYGANSAEPMWLSPYVYFGDGGGTSYPPTTLDIVAHELGHAYTGLRSKLEAVGEAAGINEAFADMTAQAALFFATEKANFLIGAGTTKTGKAIRDMCYPTSDGVSIDNYDNFRADMDGHYSCGLYNKVFCMLSAGGRKQTVDDWYQAFAYANIFHWKQMTTFKQGVCGVLYVLRDFWNDTEAIKDAKAAFAKVNLACPKSDI